MECEKAGFIVLDYCRITRHRAPIPSERTATRPVLAMVGPPLLCEVWRRPDGGETTMAPAFTPQPPRPFTRLPPFQYLLLSLFAFLVLQPYMLHGRMGYLLFVASECALLVTGGLAASIVTRWRRRLTLTLAAATALSRAGHMLVPAPELDLAALVVFLAFLVCITWSLIRTLLEHPTVQRNTLYSAACSYLL